MKKKIEMLIEKMNDNPKVRCGDYYAFELHDKNLTESGQYELHYLYLNESVDCLETDNLNEIWEKLISIFNARELEGKI